MPEIFSTISCNLDGNILSTALPLFEAEKIEAVEWSFDTLFKVRNIPEWFVELLHAFGKENRLIGHGVYFSLFSGRWLQEQEVWLAHLRKVCETFKFDHVSEHFGFMTGENFHQGAPISIPFTNATLAIGRDRLNRIYHACGCPVGLENLAFSYSLEEVKRHGDFLNQLVEPINGFIILDLHNVYCQLHNFNISFQELISFYPLDRVREIHISGGSWEDSNILPGRKIRRDTHDNGVPEEVFQLLEMSIPQCPNVKYVVMEQLSLALGNNAKKTLFREDFTKLDRIVKRLNNAERTAALNNFLPLLPLLPPYLPIEDDVLYAQQLSLSDILEKATGYEHAQQLLQSSILSNTAWQVDKWEPFMLETAISIAQKWKYGFA